MRVFIETSCRDASALYGNLLVFKTIRVGFPTARVTVYDYVSPAEFSRAIEQAALLAGCEFESVAAGDRQGPEFHGHFMEERLFATDPDEPIVFVDPDVIFWESLEDLPFEKYGLFAGRYLPRIFENDAIQEPHIHSSLFVIPNPGQLVSAVREIQKHTPYFRPLVPSMYFREDGTKVISDIGASLYGALGDRCYVFSEDQLNRYDHLMAGTMLADHARFRMNPATIAAISESHEAVKRGDIESLRGLWRKQDRGIAVLAAKATSYDGHMTQEVGHRIPGPVVSWNYLSGRVRADGGQAFGFSVARFSLDGKHVSTHFGVSDLETGKFWNGECDIRALSKFVFDTCDTAVGKITVLLPQTTKLVEHKSVRYGFETKYSSTMSECTGWVERGGERTVLHGDYWRDYEEIPAALVRGWDWLSIRLDDGGRIMLYGPHEGEKFGTLIGNDTVTHLGKEDFTVTVTDSYISEKSLHVYPCAWHVRVLGLEYDVVPVVRDQELFTTGPTYWEGACHVTQNGKEVGYAFAELTGYRPLTEGEMGMRWSKGNRDAVALMHMFGVGSHIADDFVDGDVKPGRETEKMTELLSLAMGALPNNKFYAANRAALEPVVMTGLALWGASNDWAKSGRRDTRMHGFVYRNSLEHVLITIALIIGGMAWAQRVARETHVYYHSRPDGQTFAEWETEMGVPRG